MRKQTVSTYASFSAGTLPNLFDLPYALDVLASAARILFTLDSGLESVKFGFNIDFSLEVKVNPMVCLCLLLVSMYTGSFP